MMDGSSSGFEDESLILCNKFTLNKMNLMHLSSSQHTTHNNLKLDDLHKQLLQHLKKAKIIPRKELTSYLNQIKKVGPCDPKSQWLLMKVRGLLHFILKKRSDFQCSLVEGEIIIYEKSASLQEKETSVTEIAESPKYYSQPNSDLFEMPQSFLTNNNFTSSTAIQEHNDMEIEQYYNYSQDLFSDNVASLHSISQENYNIMNQLVQNVDVSGVCSSENDKLFKVPSVSSTHLERACQVHESLEENYSSLVSSIPQVPVENTALESISKVGNIFDDLTITNEELGVRLDRAYGEAKNVVSEIVDGLINLEISEVRTSKSVAAKNKVRSELDESTASDRSFPMKACNDEENLKIIREVCIGFRENLMASAKKDENLEVLRDILNSFN